VVPQPENYNQTIHCHENLKTFVPLQLVVLHVLNETPDTSEDDTSTSYLITALHFHDLNTKQM
jgi:hypothetical protein